MSAFKTFTTPEVLLWAAVPIVTGVMALLFAALSELLGRKRGYLVAFVFYWLGFGFLFSLFVAGPERLLAALRPAPLPGGLAGVALALALLVPPALAGLTVFRPRLPDVTAAVLAASAALAVVNALAEELLWRAAFVRVFSDNILLAVLVPALGFAVWHLAPLIVLPSTKQGGAISFVAAAFLMGLVWGTVAWMTGSVFLTVLSHVATDFLGLGGFAYLSTRQGAPARLDEPREAS